jgi:hypothetical protein
MARGAAQEPTSATLAPTPRSAVGGMLRAGGHPERLLVVVDLHAEPVAFLKGFYPWRQSPERFASGGAQNAQPQIPPSLHVGEEFVQAREVAVFPQEPPELGSVTFLQQGHFPIVLLISAHLVRGSD